MSDDPKYPELPEPVDPLDQAAGASQPAELPGELPGSLPTLPASEEVPQATEDVPTADDAGSTDAQAGEDYVSEIRQTLVTEERSTRKSGSLIRRITGSLRRTTGELRKKTGPVEEVPPDAPPAEPVVPAEIGDDFLADRLGGASVSEPIYLPPRLDVDPETWAAFEAEALAGASQMDEDETQTDAESAASLLLEAGLPDAAAADEQAEGGPQTPDWISEIRQGRGEQGAPGAGDEPPGETEPVPPSAEKSRVRGSRPLRAIITGLLRLGERGGAPAGEDISDAVVTGRLERSLEQEAAAEEAPAAADAAAQAAAADESTAAQAAGLDEQFDEVSLFAARLRAGEVDLEDDDAFLEELKSRLGAIEAESPLPGASGISPEDEAFLNNVLINEDFVWGGEPETGEEGGSPLEAVTFTPEDVWGEEEEELPAEPGLFAPISDEMYAAAFLTGKAVLPDAPLSNTQDSLLREALEKTPESDEDVTVDDLRATALEDYQEVSEAPRAPRMEDYVSPLLKDQAEPEVYPGMLTEEEAALEKEQEAPFWRRVALDGVLKKVLIVEAVLVALALVVAVPFFIYMIARGPVYQVGYLLPRPLPANLPHPTGVRLPGGWHFPLQKSTFVEGHWKPAAAEWLEGTELRRVVALPWNPQTEAVIRSFNPGDKVLLDMSNNDSLTYTVRKIERVAQSDSQILADPSPSLLIVLYQEQSAERWVVFAEP